MMTQNPFILLYDSLTDVPMLVDFSDNPYEQGVIINRNKYLIGPPGALTNVSQYLMARYLQTGSHLLVVDEKGSHRSWCATLGGRYHDYGPETHRGFNPFQTSSQPAHFERIENVADLLVWLWETPDFTPSQLDKQSIMHLLKVYFEDSALSAQPNSGFDSFYGFVQVTAHAILAERGIAPERVNLDCFARQFAVYKSTGRKGWLMNDPNTTVDVSQALQVFNLSALAHEPKLLTTARLLLLDQLYATVSAPPYELLVK